MCTCPTSSDAKVHCVPLWRSPSPVPLIIIHVHPLIIACISYVVESCIMVIFLTLSYCGVGLNTQKLSWHQWSPEQCEWRRKPSTGPKDCSSEPFPKSGPPGEFQTGTVQHDGLREPHHRPCVGDHGGESWRFHAGFHGPTRALPSGRWGGAAGGYLWANSVRRALHGRPQHLPQGRPAQHPGQHLQRELQGRHRGGESLLLHR